MLIVMVDEQIKIHTDKFICMTFIFPILISNLKIWWYFADDTGNPFKSFIDKLNLRINNYLSCLLKLLCIFNVCIDTHL